jgi:signal transduction histidine kinase/FixJ family two-component response regulator
MTIRKKLIAIQLFTALVVLVLGSAFLVTREIRITQESLVSSLSSTAAVIGENSVSTLVFLDRQSAGQVLASLSAEKQIAGACIYDSEGSVFATYTRRDLPSNVFPAAVDKVHRFTEDHLELFQPILKSGLPIGTVFLRADLTQMSERIDGYVRDAVWVLVFGLLLSIVLSLVTQGTISRPILDLVTTTRQVSETSDYSQRAPERSTDELGTLARALNEMLGLIQKRDVSLLEARDTLEQRVEERTEELEEAKTQLEQALESEHDARTNAEEARRIAETANRTKSLFLANMSHEIRTPLNAIMGYAQILESDPDLAERHQRAIRTVGESGEHLLSLINDVLDISKIEAGRERLNVGDFDLKDLLSGLGKMFDIRCQEKGLIWRLDTDLKTKAVLGDENKVRQVLINLLGNAVKFTTEGEIVLRASEDDLHRYTFEVVDTGPGIEPDRQASVFESFQQDTEGLHHGGTGLGLAISSRHVELMGGQLDIESEVGRGSCFSFTVTLPPGEAESNRASRADYTGVTGIQGETVNALVVDDVETNRDILEQILARIGVEVLSVDSGYAALDSVKDSRPDIIFLDIRMPGMDGAETQRRLVAEHGRDLTIIAVTASVFEHQKQAYRDAGFTGFIDKPMRAEQIYAALEQHLGVDFEKVDQTQVAETMDSLTNVALSQDLLGRLEQAIESHSITDLRSALETVSDSGPREQALATQMSDLANQYDIEGLKKILIRLQDGKPV